MSDAPYPAEFEIDTADAAPLGEWDVAEHLEQLWSLRSNMTFRARRELETTSKLEDRLDRVQKHWGDALRTAVANADELRHVVEELERSAVVAPPVPPPAAAPTDEIPDDAPEETATAADPTYELPSEETPAGDATAVETTDDEPAKAEPPPPAPVVDDAPAGDGAVVVEGQSSGWFGWILGGGEKAKPAPSAGTAPTKPAAGKSSKGTKPSAAPTGPAPPAEHIEVLGRLWRLTRTRLEQLDVHYVPLVDRDLDTVEFEGRPVKRWVTVKNKPRGEQLVVATEILGLWVRVEGDSLAPLQRAEVLLH